MRSVPHITNAIQDWIERVAKLPVDESGAEPDVCIIELGKCMPVNEVDQADLNRWYGRRYRECAIHSCCQSASETSWQRQLCTDSRLICSRYPVSYCPAVQKRFQGLTAE